MLRIPAIRWGAFFRYVAVAAAISSTTGVFELLQPHVTLVNAALVYLLLVVAVGAIWGLGTAMFATVAATVAFDFAYLPPTHNLVTNGPEDVVALVGFFVLTGLTGGFLARSRQHEAEARARERDAAVLYELSSLVASNVEAEATLNSICRRVRQTFLMESCAVIVPVGEELEVMAIDGARVDSLASADEHERVRDAMASAEPLPRQQRQGASWPWSRGRQHVPEFVVYVPLRGQDDEALGVMRVSGQWPFPRTDPGAARLLAAFAQVAVSAIVHTRLLTDATRTRALEEADVLKAALLAAVSHELRTPLGAIKSSVTSLLEVGQDWNESDRREFLGTIDHETDRLSKLVTNLLDLSRIEGGAYQPDGRWYDIREFLETTLNRLRRLHPTHELQLEIAGEAGDAFFDYVQLGQVVANLVENATKFSPPGSPIVVVAAREDDTFTVRVRDEGMGVRRIDRERIFERFYRGRQNEGPAIPGTGLGLTISKGIVESHGGSLAVEDSEGRTGATFVLSLPVGGLAAPLAAEAAR